MVLTIPVWLIADIMEGLLLLCALALFMGVIILVLDLCWKVMRYSAVTVGVWHEAWEAWLRSLRRRAT